MNRKSLASVLVILVLGADLARISSASSPPRSGLEAAESNSNQENSQAAPLRPVAAVEPLVYITTQAPVIVSRPSNPPQRNTPTPTTPPTRPCLTTPTPCSASALTISLPLPNPCAKPSPCRPLPPLPPKPTLPPKPSVRPCVPVCPTPPPCRPACPVAPAPTCGCGSPSKLPLVGGGLGAIALKGLKVWKLGTTKLAAPALLAGGKVIGAAALLPVKLALKGLALGGLIAKPIIIGKTLITAGAVKLAATVVGIPVAIVTGAKLAAAKIASLFSVKSGAACSSCSSSSLASSLSGPLRLARGLKLVAVGTGVDALASLLDRAGRSAVEKAQTLATYGAATQALGSSELAWGFENEACEPLYVLQPVDAKGHGSGSGVAAAGSGSGVTAAASGQSWTDEDDWIIPPGQQIVGLEPVDNQL